MTVDSNKHQGNYLFFLKSVTVLKHKGDNDKVSTSKTCKQEVIFTAKRGANAATTFTAQIFSADKNLGESEQPPPTRSITKRFSK